MGVPSYYLLRLANSLVPGLRRALSGSLNVRGPFQKETHGSYQ
jgi:hypothetical protein